MLTSTHIDGRLIYYFDSRFFSLNGQDYEIYGTRIGNNSRAIGESIHSVKRLSDCMRKDVKHSELVGLLVKEKNNKLMPDEKK